VEIFCKQVAIICIAGKDSTLDFEDSIHIRQAETPYGEFRGHSAILYFGALGAPGIPLASKKREKKQPALDKDFGLPHTGIEMQLSGNYENPDALLGSLVDLHRGDAAILDGIDLPRDEARRLMELGFLPGMRITAGRSAPGGDPRVFQVDGSEIALRRETARRLKVRREKKVANSGRIPGA
jgi:Fe2+ transport system protein FeoA